MSNDTAATEELKKKVSVREFLSRYRNSGLPSAKKFRKRTRIQVIEGERDFFMRVMQNGAEHVAIANRIIKDLLDGMVIDENHHIDWEGEKVVLEKAQAWLDQFRTASRATPLPQSAPTAPPTPTTDDAASSTLPAQADPL